ncbi:MAG: DUF2203 domain-containing protein [Planctomycetes bacterium]|nr:DUF2203 domain-containing protein [Planctomycetota bacterium]
MATEQQTQKKFFTLEEANATLPLLRAILRDITDLAKDLRRHSQQLSRLEGAGQLDRAHQEEIQHILAEFERGQDRMRDFENELRELNVELKDHFTGLIDFPCWKDDRVIYLCWRLGEPEVAHWHEIDSGFAGRKPLPRIS